MSQNIYRSEVTMASMMSTSQPPTSLMSSNSLITFGGKENNKNRPKNKGNKVTPQDLDSAARNDCGLPKYANADQEKSGQINPKNIISRSSSQNIYANQKVFKESDQLQQELKTNILQHSNSHQNNSNKKLDWPRGTIPRSVKKLSWDDETLEQDKNKISKNNFRLGKEEVDGSGIRSVTMNRDKDREVPAFMDVNVSLTPLSPVTRQGLLGDPVFLET